jgi:hypothetical protein
MAYAVPYGFETGKSDSGAWRRDRSEAMCRLRQKQALGSLKIIEALMAVPDGRKRNMHSLRTLKKVFLNFPHSTK